MCCRRTARKGTVMGKRIGLIDEIRGFTYIAMIIYHAYYDIVFVYGHALPDIVNTVMRFIQPLIAGTFIVIAGISSNFSSNNFKRGTLYFFCGMLLTFATAVAMPSELIVFGILHFMGFAAMIYGFIGKFTERIPSIIGIVLFSLLFAATLNVPLGYIGINGLFSAPLPSFLYGHYWLFPLGFTSSAFYSSDYFPLIPNLFLFLAGASLGVYLKSGRAPKGIYPNRFKAMSFIGRHGIWIYLLHQPVIILVLDIIFKLTGQGTVFL